MVESNYENSFFHLLIRATLRPSPIVSSVGDGFVSRFEAVHQLKMKEMLNQMSRKSWAKQKACQSQSPRNKVFWHFSRCFSPCVNHSNAFKKRSKQQLCVWAHYGAIYGSSRCVHKASHKRRRRDWTVTGRIRNSSMESDEKPKKPQRACVGARQDFRSSLMRL